MAIMRSEEDLAYVAWMDADYERWARVHADVIAEELYQEWAEDRRDDGEDDSRDAYDAYLESMLPDD